MKKNELIQIDYSKYTKNQKKVMQIKDEINEASLNGTLPEYVHENQIEFQRDSGGKVIKAIISVSTPYIYLDLFEHPGYVIVEWDYKERGVSGISLSVLDDVLSFFEEFENAK